MDRRYFFGASNEMPHFVKTANGCIFESNDHTFRIVAQKYQYWDAVRDIQVRKIKVIYRVKEDGGWVKCDGFLADTIEDVFKYLQNDERFTKATKEYESQRS